MASAARIVLLNGPGSVGKTSVARAMQALASGPLLHLSMDGFCEMLPDRYQDHPDTFSFKARIVGGLAVTDVTTGPSGAALLGAMRRTVAVLADAGFDLVVDDVWLDGEPAAYADLLAGHRVWRVGLTAPLAVLEAREAARGDRMTGLSPGQVGRVHEGARYDLTIDMVEATPEAAAEAIMRLTGF
jgi:chloramphenicol 3-O phosphotransferase